MKQKDKTILSSRLIHNMTQYGALRRPPPFFRQSGPATAGRGRLLWGDYTLQTERINPPFLNILLFTDREGCGRIPPRPRERLLPRE